MSNNPFVEQSEPSGFAHRFPDLNSPVGPSQWQQPSPAPGFPQQQSYSQPGYASPYGSQQQQGQGYLQPNATGYGAQGGFQPSSSFGQQLSAQLNTGYVQTPQPQYGQQSLGYQPTGASGWTPQQQQQHQQAISQFDPFSQLGQLDAPQGSGAGLFGGPVPPASPAHARSFLATSGPAAPTVTSSTQPPGQLHPREFVHRHKGELELWDAYAWKQLLNTFEALKGTWEVRKREAEDRIRGIGGAVNWDYGAAQEAQRLQSLAKEADNNADTIAACSFQTKEVHTSYRQSGDVSSKRRVREAINAALTSLPEWPPQGNW